MMTCHANTEGIHKPGVLVVCYCEWKNALTDRVLTPLLSLIYYNYYTVFDLLYEIHLLLK